MRRHRVGAVGARRLVGARVGVVEEMVMGVAVGRVVPRGVGQRGLGWWWMLERGVTPSNVNLRVNVVRIRSSSSRGSIIEEMRIRVGSTLIESGPLARNESHGCTIDHLSGVNKIVRGLSAHVFCV